MAGHLRYSLARGAGWGRSEPFDPVASMQAINNRALHEIAGQVREVLAKAVAQ